MSNFDAVAYSLQERLDNEVGFFRERAMTLMKKVEDEGLDITLQHNAEISSIPFTMTGHSWDEHQISRYCWVVSTRSTVPNEFESLPLALDFIDGLLKKD